MSDKDVADIIELVEIRANIDSIIECCVLGEIDKNEMLAQIWLQVVLTHESSQIIH